MNNPISFLDENGGVVGYVSAYGRLITIGATISANVTIGADHKGNVGVFVGGSIGFGLGVGAVVGASLGVSLTEDIFSFEGAGSNIGGLIATPVGGVGGDLQFPSIFDEGALSGGDYGSSLDVVEPIVQKFANLRLSWAYGAGVGGYAEFTYNKLVFSFNIKDLLNDMTSKKFHLSRKEMKEKIKKELGRYGMDLEDLDLNDKRLDEILDSINNSQD